MFFLSLEQNTCPAPGGNLPHVLLFSFFPIFWFWYFSIYRCLDSSGQYLLCPDVLFVATNVLLVSFSRTNRDDMERYGAAWLDSVTGCRVAVPSQDVLLACLFAHMIENMGYRLFIFGSFNILAHLGVVTNDVLFEFVNLFSNTRSNPLWILTSGLEPIRREALSRQFLCMFRLGPMLAFVVILCTSGSWASEAQSDGIVLCISFQSIFTVFVKRGFVKRGFVSDLIFSESFLGTGLLQIDLQLLQQPVGRLCRPNNQV